MVNWASCNEASSLKTLIGERYSKLGQLLGKRSKQAEQRAQIQNEPLRQQITLHYNRTEGHGHSHSCIE